VIGTGFTNRVESISAGVEQLLAIRLRGESGLKVTFDAAGEKVDSGDLAYVDSVLGLSVVVATNLDVTASSCH
jgi:hypothetical protein